MIQVELSKIIIDEKRQDQIIVLKEKSGDRQFPIVIGFLEASSIKMKLSGLEPPRPMTHDLLASIIEGLEALRKQSRDLESQVARMVNGVTLLEEAFLHLEEEIKAVETFAKGKASNEVDSAAKELLAS